MDSDKVLKIVTSNPILEVSRETGMDPVELIKFYNNLENLLKKDVFYREVIDKFVFAIILNTADQEDQAKFNIFDIGTFIDKIKTGIFTNRNTLSVDYNGNAVVEEAITFLIGNYVQAARLSEERQGIVFFIQHVSVHLFANGKPIDYIPNIIESDRVGVTTPNNLPASDYRRLVKKQYTDMVYKERAFKYWRNKGKRILVDNPEICFHKPLWWYLDRYTDGAKVDSQATTPGTDDRTDIRIICLRSGDIYIVELKCLGKTKSSSEKADDWANEGLVQINQYLDDEPDSVEGTLVLYDGRREDKDIQWCDAIQCNPKYNHDSIRFYLESESASVKAKTTIRSLKRKSK